MQRVLLRTPLWRREIRRQAVGLAWRLLSRTAFAYRTTVVRKVRVVAVVGTYGKTTTSRAVAGVLGSDDKHRHPPHAIMKLRPTDRWAVLEVAISAPGQMAPYARMVRPQVVVVTSIGTEHRAMLKSTEGTRQEKAEMVRALGPEGLALLNGDDPNVRWMATQTRAVVRTFGFGPDNDVRGSDIDLDWPHGTRFTLHADGETRPLHLRLVGRHMLYPVLAAVSVALAEGVSLDHAVAVLEALPPGSNRVEPMALPCGAFLLRDNCKSSIETVDAALDLLAEIPASRKIVVLGDLEHAGTTLDEIYATYERLGGRVAEVAGRAGRAVFVNVDIDGARPRYTPGALAAGMPASAIVETTTVLEAVAAIGSDLGPGDVLLLEGSGQQRFDRITLALAGRTVRCNIVACGVWGRCTDCQMLETGWDERALRALNATYTKT